MAPQQVLSNKCVLGREMAFENERWRRQRTVKVIDSVFLYFAFQYVSLFLNVVHWDAPKILQRRNIFGSFWCRCWWLTHNHSSIYNSKMGIKMEWLWSVDLHVETTFIYAETTTLVTFILLKNSNQSRQCWLVKECRRIHNEGTISLMCLTIQFYIPLLCWSRLPR